MTNDLKKNLDEARWLDVEVRGTSAEVDRLLRSLDSHLLNGWIRDEVREKRLKDANIWLDGTRLYSFSDCSGRGIASISVCQIEPGLIRAGQSVPLGRSSADYEQFQKRVIEFKDRIFIPAVVEAGLSVGYQNRPHPLESDLDPPARRALHDFIEQAPKSIAKFKEEDRRRWQSFLIAMHRTRSFPQRAALEDWLTRQEFSMPDVEELSREFARGLTLLEEYEEERQQSWR